MEAGTAGSLRDLRQRLAARLERDAFKLYATVRGLLGYVVIIADGTRHKWYINAKNENFLPFFVLRFFWLKFKI